MKIRYLFTEKVFTVSNFLTILRVIVVPFVTYFMYLENVTGDPMYRYHQFVFFMVIVISDFFDGYLARTFNQVSKLGQYLDPVADKICLLCIGGSLVYYKGFPLWMLLIGLCREIFFVFSALFLFYKRDVEVKPNMPGKISVACMALSAIIYLLSIDHLIFPYAGVKELSIFFILVFYISGSILYVKTYSVYYTKKAY